MLTFKTQRAAQMSMAKAEKAYAVASAAERETYLAWCCDHTSTRDASVNAHEANKAARETAHDHAETVHAAVKAAGFCVRSRMFDYDPTRELISANID